MMKTPDEFDPVYLMLLFEPEGTGRTPPPNGEDPLVPAKCAVSEVLGPPSEIGDWLEGCFKLEPDGTVTSVMDLSLDPPDEPPQAIPHVPAKPPKNRLFGVVLSLVFILLVCLFYGLALTGSRPFFGLSFFAAPDGPGGGWPWGALIVTKQADPNRICLGDNVVYAVPDNDLTLRKVAGIVETDTAARVFQLRTTGRDDDFAADGQIIGVVSAALPGLGLVLRLIQNHFLPALAVPTALLIVSALVLLKTSRGVKRKTKRLFIQTLLI